MRAATKLPSIPDSQTLDQGVGNVVGPIKEIIEVREGRRGSDNLDKHVTYRDLVTLGLITEAQVPTK